MDAFRHTRFKRACFERRVCHAEPTIYIQHIYRKQDKRQYFVGRFLAKFIHKRRATNCTSYLKGLACVGCVVVQGGREALAAFPPSVPLSQCVSEFSVCGVDARECESGRLNQARLANSRKFGSRECLSCHLVARQLRHSSIDFLSLSLVPR